MKVRIPSLPPRARALFDRYLDWVNVPISKRGARWRRGLDLAAKALRAKRWTRRWRRVEIGSFPSVALAQGACERDAERRCRRDAGERGPVDARISRSARRGGG